MTQEEQNLTKIDQVSLDKIIVRHEAFRKGKSNGARANLSHHDLTGLNLKERDLSHADFTGAVLYESNLERANLDYALFYACDLRKASFRNASLVRADLRGACLRGAVMTGADLTSADLREGSFATFDPEKGLSFISDNEAWDEGTGGVDLRGANLGSVKLSGAVAMNSNFEDANLSKSVIIRGNLSGANLSGANLEGADLSQCEIKNVNLSGANLSGTMMDFTNLENVDLTGALTDQPTGHTLEKAELTLEEMIKEHQLWLKTKGLSGKQLNLSDFDLRGMPSIKGVELTMIIARKAIWYGLDLSLVNMQAAQLEGGDFRNCAFTSADLRGNSFSQSNMVGTKFLRANMAPLVLDSGAQIKTTFSWANLRYADFSNSCVRGVDFAKADLSFSNFTNADTRDANFYGANLHETKISLNT